MSVRRKKAIVSPRPWPELAHSLQYFILREDAASVPFQEVLSEFVGQARKVWILLKNRLQFIRLLLESLELRVVRIEDAKQSEALHAIVQLHNLEAG